MGLTSKKNLKDERLLDHSLEWILEKLTFDWNPIGNRGQLFEKMGVGTDQE